MDCLYRGSSSSAGSDLSGFFLSRVSFLKEVKELVLKRRQILASKTLSEDEKNTRLQSLMLRNPLGSGPPLSIEDLG